MKRILIVLLAMVFAFSLAACGGGGDKDGDSGKDKKAERVTTASGAISVEALDMPDYITKAKTTMKIFLWQRKEKDTVSVTMY